MNRQPLDAFTRSARGAFDRKTSLKLLGAALLGAAAVHPLQGGTRARKKKKKKGSNGNTGVVAPIPPPPPPPDPHARCRPQKDQCVTFVQEQCARNQRMEAAAAAGDPLADCVTRATPCCEAMVTCNLAATMECLFLRPTEK
jgi:hypothetical protein